jgi:hypothetical protein
MPATQPRSEARYPSSYLPYLSSRLRQCFSGAVVARQGWVELTPPGLFEGRHAGRARNPPCLRGGFIYSYARRFETA